MRSPMNAVWTIAAALLGATASLGAEDTRDLELLLRQAEVTYSARGEGTFEVPIRGENGLHSLIVRRVDGVLGIWCTPYALAEPQVPARVWAYLAEVNAQSRLAHVGYAQGRFVVVTGHAIDRVTPAMLKLMVMDVAIVSDTLLPKLKAMLATE